MSEFIDQAVKACVDKPGAPLTDGGQGVAQPAEAFRAGDIGCTFQHEPGAQGDVLGGFASSYPPLQLVAFAGGECEFG